MVFRRRTEAMKEGGVVYISTLKTLLTSSLPREESAVAEKFHGETKPTSNVSVLVSALPMIKISFMHVDSINGSYVVCKKMSRF